MKRYYETLEEARKAEAELKEKRGRTVMGCPDGVNVYDLKKSFPKRVKTRYFVGDYFEYLNI